MAKTEKKYKNRVQDVYADVHPEKELVGTSDMARELSDTHQDFIGIPDLDIDHNVFYAGCYFDGKTDKMGTQRTVFSIPSYYHFLIDKAASACIITGSNHSDISKTLTKGLLVMGASICTKKHKIDGGIVDIIVSIGRRDVPSASAETIRHLVQAIDVSKKSSKAYIEKLAKKYAYSRYGAALWLELGKPGPLPMYDVAEPAVVPENVIHEFEKLLDKPLGSKAYSLKLTEDGKHSDKEIKPVRKDYYVSTRYHALVKRYEQHIRPSGCKADIHRMFFTVGLYAFGYMLIHGSINYDELAAGRIISSLIDFGSKTR